MTWVALAGVVLTAWAPSAGTRRLAALAEHGRLGAVATHRRPAARRIPWLRLRGAATAAAAGLVCVAGGVALGVAVATAGWTAARLARDMARRRAAAEAERQLASAVRVLVGELETGTRPAAALLAAAEAAPLHATTFHSAAALSAGSGPAGTALCRDPRTRALGIAWELGSDSGAALAGVLARVAADLASAQEQSRAVAVVLAGPRSSAAVLAALPVLGFGLGTLLGARPWVFLLGSDAGRVVTSAGVLLDLAGLWWMRAILRRAEHAC